MSISNNTNKLQSLMDKINALPEAGIDLPELTNEGSASDLLSGKQLIDQDGNIVTGTIQTKTSSNLTASGATVTVPAGYYASQVTKSVGTATQVTPSISVSSSGLITASATQSAGYVSAGTKSATKQLTVQAAQTITPSTSNKTIASGRYLTGTQTIKGDANLVAGNIKSGVSIFGVSGSYAGTEAENLDEEMATQDALIASIQSKLDGDVSGTANIETCRISIECDDIYAIYYTGVVDGEIAFQNSYGGVDNGFQISDVLTGSVFVVSSNKTGATSAIKGSSNFECHAGYIDSPYTYFICSTTGDCAITGYSNDGVTDW